MIRLLRHLLCCAALALAGCTTLPPAAPSANPEAQQAHLRKLASIEDFSLVGRMAVQTERRGFSGSLHWKHTVDGDQFAMYSPLGAQVAEIQSDASGVTLTTNDHKTYTAQTAGELLQKIMGWSLPLDGLSDWVLGRPTKGAYETLAWDGQGRLTRLRQDGWEIEYPAYIDNDGTALPGKILLRSRELDLKLLVERWGTLKKLP